MPAIVEQHEARIGDVVEDRDRDLEGHHPVSPPVDQQDGRLDLGANFPPSCKMRHDRRRHKLMGLHVVAIVAVDQQLHAGVLVLADQIDGFGHGADKAP